ncbi:MAG: hypothetical protein ACLQO7_03400 [Candidatus Bathyarchaeia archaeon]
MVEDYRLTDYPSVAVNRWQPLWTPKDTPNETKAHIVAGAPAPVGSCEFAGALIWEGATGRTCNLSGPCFLFADPKAYASCPSRIERLKELQKSRKQP